MAVITVSREYGSHGEEIAQQVAKKLGYSYFDKEILAEVARTIDTAESQISLYDEKGEHGLRTFLKKLFIAHPIPVADFTYHYPPGLPLEWQTRPVAGKATLERLPLDADKVTSFFHEVIEKLWKRNNVVIVGRGSQKILAAKPGTLHVRFIAPVGVRVESVVAQEGISDTEALKKIQMIDKQRAHYLKRYYNADWRDARLYHIIINTRLMHSEQVTHAIRAAICHLDEMA